MDCRAPMPHKVIRDIIEKDILPRFSKVFVQPDEGMAPDGNGKLDSQVALLGVNPASFAPFPRVGSVIDNILGCVAFCVQVA